MSVSPFVAVTPAFHPWPVGCWHVKGLNVCLGATMVAAFRPYFSPVPGTSESVIGEVGHFSRAYGRECSLSWGSSYEYLRVFRNIGKLSQTSFKKRVTSNVYEEFRKKMNLIGRIKKNFHSDFKMSHPDH